MSKIYEALERAEQERKQNGAAEADQENLRSGQRSEVVLSDPQSAKTEPASPQRGEEQRPVAVSTPPFAASQPVEHPSPSVQTWHPRYEKLPALESRGKEAEQFRTLRAKLMEYRGLNKLKTVLISSGQPEEGKSFIAVNLAITLARHSTSRVALIDGDLRRGTLHDILGAPNTTGLADYLSGKAALQDVLQRGQAEPEASLPPSLKALTLMTAGKSGDNSVDLSSGPRLAELVKILPLWFDWIIIDSSPVNIVTDGVNLARACDGVLLVARSGVTRYQAAQQALFELKASKVLGVVLNASKELPAGVGYYGYDNRDDELSAEPPSS